MSRINTGIGVTAIQMEDSKVSTSIGIGEAVARPPTGGLVQTVAF